MGAGRVLGVHRGRVAVAAVASAILISALGAAPAAFGARPAANCQPYGNRPCLLPFPDNRFSKADPTSATGLRVQMPIQAMPTNTAGAQIKVAEYNRNDGFSPGSMIVARIPGLDNPTALNKTNPVRLTDMSQAFKPAAPIVVIDAKTGNRHLIWAELDSNASDAGAHHAADPPRPELRLRAALHRRPPEPEGQERERAPGAELVRGAPRQPAGQQHLPARSASATPRSSTRSIRRGSSATASMRPGTSRWAAARGSAGRMLQIRNDAFGQLGDHNLADSTVQGIAPPFQRRQCPEQPGHRDHALRHRHLHRAVLPAGQRLSAGLELQLQLEQAGRTAHPEAGQRRDGALLLHRSRTRRRQRPAAPRSMGTGCSATAPR